MMAVAQPEICDRGCVWRAHVARAIIGVRDCAPSWVRGQVFRVTQTFCVVPIVRARAPCSPCVDTRCMMAFENELSFDVYV